MNSILIASTKKSSGKTTVAIGLAAVLSKEYKQLSVFKKGPDYIDPLWLSAASNHPCYNLDFHTMSNKEIKDFYHQKISKSEISLIEANKGLFDGVSLNGNDSNAALAKLLGLKVVLVIDCEGMTRGIAPLLNGYKNFDKKIQYHGVILNKVNGGRHEAKLIASIEKYCDIKVLGSVWKNKNLIIDEQHLGLQPSFLDNQAQEKIRAIKKVIKTSVDITKFTSLSKKNPRTSTILSPHSLKKFKNITIGVASDKAFGFYYQDDIDKFLNHGVKIKYINTIKDKKLPSIDALIIGGGFPELSLDELSKNNFLKKEIKGFINNYGPTYAECGGLMYLSKSIKFKNRKYKMVGAINGDILMHNEPVGRGYVNLEIKKNHPWFSRQKSISCHEFHHSKLEGNFGRNDFVFNVKRGYGVNGKCDGIIVKNLIATYSHIRDTSKTRWIKNFLDFIVESK